MSGDPGMEASLANERTFLAWVRTALSCMGAGGAILKAPAPTGRLVGFGMIALGAFLLAVSSLRYRQTQAAIAGGTMVASARLLRAVGISVTVAAVGALVLGAFPPGPGL